MQWYDYVSLILGIVSVAIGIVGLALGGVAVHKVIVVNKSCTDITNKIDSSNTNNQSTTAQDRGIVIPNQKAVNNSSIQNINLN